jgi:hypothetical protein
MPELTRLQHDESMKSNQVMNLVSEYEAGHISIQDLHMSLLQAAESTRDHDLFVSRIPDEHMEGLARCVEHYALGDPLVQVGGARAVGPGMETIRSLRRALATRVLEQSRRGGSW